MRRKKQDNSKYEKLVIPFIQNCHESVFLDYLIFYDGEEDAFTFSKEGATYNFSFKKQDTIPSGKVKITLNDDQTIAKVTCSCNHKKTYPDEHPGYCIHILAAYIKILESLNDGFDFFDFMCEGDYDDCWLSLAELEDDEDEEFDFDEFDSYEEFEQFLPPDFSKEEFEQMMNFDIVDVLSDLSKQELLNFLDEIIDSHPIVRLAFLQKFGEAMGLADNYDSFDEYNEIDNHQNILFRTNKPS